VEKSGDYGIYGDGKSFSVLNCTIANNQEIGIYCNNGNLTMQWSNISDNGWYGIYHFGSGKLLTVENSKIHDNQWDGIYTSSSTSTIINSMVYQNGLGSTTYNFYYGISLLNPSNNPAIHNNTIVHNVNEGIRFTGSNTPDVANCILWYNNWDESYKVQIDGIDFTDISHCCITDPNDPGVTSPGTDAETGNITYEPDFVYDLEPYGYYHIKYGSECRNAGDNSVYNVGDVDMDNTERKQEDTIDIGADEVACLDTYDLNDITFNGVINLHDFRLFSDAWLSHDPEEPGLTDPNLAVGWNSLCNLDDAGDSEYMIDLADFYIFCENWLWQACWRSDYVECGMMMGGGETMMMAPAASAISFESAPQPSASVENEPVVETHILAQIIYIVDEVIKSEPDNAEGLMEMKDILEDWAEEITAQK